jgi:hypothetical protein
LEDAEVDDARVQVLVSMGLIQSGQRPDGAGVQRTVDFDVHTPPAR